MGRFAQAAAGVAAACLILWSGFALSQTAPPPSQVRPPVIVPPSGGGVIGIPQVPAGAPIPAEAKKLSFKLLGFSIKGEFPELATQRKELAAPLIGKRVTVAQIFEFADKLQQIYVKAGYPLVRVVILPQEFEGSAQIKLQVIDGYVERMDLNAIGAPVRARVGAVLAPLLRKTHLKQSELERQLLLAGEAPGLVLNATFAAGKEVGGSVLVLSGRYRAVSASVYVDDAMPASFGTWQVVTTAAENGLAGLGEQLAVSVAGDPTKDFFTAFPNRRYVSGTFTVPLGIDGWRLELFATDGRTTPYITIPGTGTFGVLDQGHVKVSYEAIKARDLELALHLMFDPTDETLYSLAVSPMVPQSRDSVRPLRAGVDGIWRGRVSGTTVTYGAEYSQGLDAFGARTAAEAAGTTVPLSQQGADAVFNKLTGHLEVNQALFSDLFFAGMAYGQTSFGEPLLLPEQYDIDGAKMLSGFTMGQFFGDAAWVVRSEVGRPVTLPAAPASLIATPYVFLATGERVIYQPTAVEFGSVHATNFGIGARLNLPSWADYAPDGYAFVEASRGYAVPVLVGTPNFSSRIFAGFLVQY